MKRTLWIAKLALALAVAQLLAAQDAGLVLRTSVSYGTQKATVPMSDEQKKQVDDLQREAQQASQSGKFGDAMRALYHGMAVMAKVPWSPAVEYTYSLQGKLDHAIVEPGAPLGLTLTPLYPTPRAAQSKVSAAVWLLPVLKDGVPKEVLAIKIAPSAAPVVAGVPLDVPAGDYIVEVRLAAEGETPTPAARGAFVKTLPVHIDTLAASLHQLGARLMKAPKKDALTTAEYAITLYQRADSGEINPGRVDYRAEFAAANSILDALDAGKDPFAGKHGDSRRAYLSSVDNTRQPYRLFVPEKYDGTKATPLVVALHGMGGDENSMFDSYSNGLLKREAERAGFLVVCPKGRDTASMYRGDAEKDVMDVLAEVRKAYKVDPARIYLMGHSMGGYGTWSTAMDHPEIFAALAPIAGGGNPAGMEKIKHIPQYVVHGDDDRTVNVSQSRTMVEAGKKAGADITYVEVPGGSHVGVAVPSFPKIIDFFQAHAKK
jgi:predicted esterase